MITTVIFDLDGTLLDTLLDLTLATNHALSKNSLPTIDIDDVRRYVGNALKMLIERAVPGGTDDTVKEKVMKDFRKYYDEHCKEHTGPYDGIEDMLKNLKARGLKIAVVSNKPDFAVKKLCEKYFHDLIDTACGEDEASGVARKPAPDMVHRALDVMGSTPGESIYVGDSDVDIETAANSGMSCISVLWGFRDKDFLIEHGADILCDKPEQICHMI